MGGEMSEMGVKIRKVMIFTIRSCYGSVRNHPFLVGMLCLLVLLYRSSPFVFSLLVSASPVLVCAAVLLGTLLSFGQPNIPEIEREERINHEISSLRTRVLGDAVVVQDKDSYSTERVTHEKREAVEQLNEELNAVINRSSELHGGDSSNTNDALVEERSREIKFENEVIEGGWRERDELEYEQKKTMHNERLGAVEAKIDDDNLGSENDKSPAESFDSERVNVASLDSPPGSPWKHVEEGEEQEEEEDETDDSGSDRAESSSPDASMADIIPLLDELHPLLDEESPAPAALSHHGSDAGSERSAKSSDSSSETDDNMKKHEDLEVGDEDNEDADDDDDEAQGIKEGQKNSAITWTEEDQKNLMDLGSSELERNQRLESLIARRRARKTMSMMPERNLIDLESVNLPVNIAPISISRNNPFDLPQDSYDNMGLPPIPGSAPSILSQRRNPFDLPYDSSEEKPDLMGDSFQQEFKVFQPKEPFFRRHESFNVAPAFFGPGRQDRQESRFRPYFVPERTDSDGASYSASFERQFSGLSDSKVSSVPETDSVVSAADDTEDKNLMEEDISRPAELLNSVPEIELRGSVEDNNFSEEDASEESKDVLKKEDRNISEEYISQGTELISSVEHVPEHVGHGSQSSEEGDFLELGQVVKEDTASHAENHNEVELKEGDLNNLVEHDRNDIHSKEDLIKQGYRSASSSSSLSEVSERIFSERDAEGLAGLDKRSDDIVEDAGISRQHSMEGSDFGTTSVLVVDTRQKEPVYDTSPTAGRKNLSSSTSMTSDVHVESEMGLPPVLIKRTVSFAERESESSGHDIEKRIYDKEISAFSSLRHPLDKNLESTKSEITKHHATKLDSSRADQVAGATSAPAVPESTADDASVDLRPLIETSVEGDVIYQHGSHDYLENQTSDLVNGTAHEVVHGVQHQTVSSEDQDLTAPEGQLHAESSEQGFHHNVPSTEDISTIEHRVDKEVAFQPEQDQTLLSSSGADFEDGHSFEPKEKQISANNQNTSEGKAVSEFDEELVFLDKSVDETSSRDNHAVQELPVIQEGEISTSVTVVQVHEQGVSPHTYSPASPESISIASEAYESRAAEGYSDVENNTLNEFDNAGQLQLLESRNFSAEAFNPQVDVQNTYDVEDEIKEIDEVLLSELDTVGDFSAKEYESGFGAFEKHVPSGEGSSSLPHIMEHIGSAIDDNSINSHERRPIMHSENESSHLVDIDRQGHEVKPVSGPQTPGACDIQPTDMSSGVLIQGEIQSSDDLRPTERVNFANENEIRLQSSRVVQDSIPEINQGMHMVEARSIEDIESMFRKAELSLVNKKETVLDRSETPNDGQISEATSSSRMPVLEARSHEDIDSAFKQTIEKETKKPKIPKEPSAMDLSYQEWHQDSSHTEPIVEPKPMEDDDFDLNQPYEEDNMHMLPGSVDNTLNGVPPPSLTSESHPEKVIVSNDSSRSREVETKEEEGTSGHVQLSATELHAQEMSQSDENAEIGMPDVQSSRKELHTEENAEVEKPETSVADIKGKGKKPHKSSSSSSSSSDSSSSDSDKE